MEADGEFFNFALISDITALFSELEGMYKGDIRSIIF